MIEEAFKEININLKKIQEDVNRIKTDLNFEKDQRNKTYGRYMAEKDSNKKLQDKLDKIKAILTDNYTFREYKELDGTPNDEDLIKILEIIGGKE